MESNRSAGFGAMMTGNGCTALAGRIRSGCVFVMFMAGAGAAAGRGRMLIRAVSFFGPRWIEGTDAVCVSDGRGALDALDSEFISSPAGFGKGCKSGEAATD
jgi:hypothetical protein